MSFVTWAEWLKGAERSTRKPGVLGRLEALARQVAVPYPAGLAICEHHAEQFTRLKDAGIPIGGDDLWIASPRLDLKRMGLLADERIQQVVRDCQRARAEAMRAGRYAAGPGVDDPVWTGWLRPARCRAARAMLPTPSAHFGRS
jgi:hypothetical protein